MSYVVTGTSYTSSRQHMLCVQKHPLLSMSFHREPTCISFLGALLMCFTQTFSEVTFSTLTTCPVSNAQKSSFTSPTDEARGAMYGTIVGNTSKCPSVSRGTEEKARRQDIIFGARDAFSFCMLVVHPDLFTQLKIMDIFNIHRLEVILFMTVMANFY